MKYICPVCKGPLGYERMDDGMIINKITELGKCGYFAYETHNKSNGYELVFCWNHKLSHKIPDALKDDVLTFIRGGNY